MRISLAEDPVKAKGKLIMPELAQITVSVSNDDGCGEHPFLRFQVVVEDLSSASNAAVLHWAEISRDGPS